MEDNSTSATGLPLQWTELPVWTDNATHAPRNDSTAQAQEEQDISVSRVMFVLYIVISVVGECTTHQ